MLQNCPCNSNLAYANCCQPFHLWQKLPNTAEQLMRSRYSAYSMQLIDYIVKTTLPMQQSELPIKELEHWARTTTWRKLEILKHLPGISKIHSLVEFKAYFKNEENQGEHHELSLFVHNQGRWYFVDPTLTRPNPKQTCFCGSGKKFKHCCGEFL